MFNRTLTPRLFAAILALLGAGETAHLQAQEILIGDRLSASVYAFDPAGNWLGTVIDNDTANLGVGTDFDGISGMAVSPDHSKLFVSSLGGNVVKYDYNYAAHKASNPVIFADSSAGVSIPNSLVFNPAGDKIYVSNLGGTGVDQFNLDGSSAGAPLFGAIGTEADPIYPYSGMAFAPDGSLLVGGFQSYSGAFGAIAKSDAGISFLSNFITPQLDADPPSTLNGVGALLVNGNTLYVTAGFAGTLTAYNATTGAVDSSFTPASGDFPASIILAPDGQSILVGFLGPIGSPGGEGYINRYGLDGTPLGQFQLLGAPLGYGEATAMLLVVPEPSTLALLACGAGAWLLARRRSRSPAAP